MGTREISLSYVHTIEAIVCLESESSVDDDSDDDDTGGSDDVDGMGVVCDCGTDCGWVCGNSGTMSMSMVVHRHSARAALSTARTSTYPRAVSDAEKDVPGCWNDDNDADEDEDAGCEDDAFVVEDISLC